MQEDLLFDTELEEALKKSKEEYETRNTETATQEEEDLAAAIALSMSQDVRHPSPPPQVIECLLTF